MKLKYDLYTAYYNCKNCCNKYHKMDQDHNGPGYCSIVSSYVEDDYSCSFYRPNKFKERTELDTNGILQQVKDPRIPKKL